MSPSLKALTLMHSIMGSNLYVHLGPHKTASTYIQARLLLNQEQLNGLGYYYEVPMRLGPGHAVIAGDILAGSANSFLGLLEKQKINHCQHTIFSSENLCALTPQKLQDLLCLVPAEYNIHIVYCLRPSAEQLQSLFQEKLKSGNPLRHSRTSDWLNVLSANDLSAIYLRNLIELCENCNATFHVLDVTRGASLDPFLQFAKCIGLSSTDLEKLQSSANQQLGANISTQPLTQLQLSWLNQFMSDSDTSIRLSNRDRVKLASMLLRGKTPDMLAGNYDSGEEIRLQLNDLAGRMIQPPPEVVALCETIDAYRVILAKPFI